MHTFLSALKKAEENVCSRAAEKCLRSSRRLYLRTAKNYFFNHNQNSTVRLSSTADHEYTVEQVYEFDLFILLVHYHEVQELVSAVFSSSGLMN